MNILIINAGSSSLKYQLMDPETGVVSAKGLCERIGIDGRLTHKVGENKVVKDIPMPSHSEAIQAVLAILVDEVDGVIKSTDEIEAVGHRVLHGGMEFFDSCIINDEVIKAIEKCIPLGPLARERMIERMHIQNVQDVKKIAFDAYCYGRCKRQIKKSSTVMIEEIESRHKGCVLLVYSGYIYIFSDDNKLITVYKNDRIPL